MTCYTSIFTFFLLGEIRNLTTLSLLPLVNNCFSLSSFFQSLGSFLSFIFLVFYFQSFPRNLESLSFGFLRSFPLQNSRILDPKSSYLLFIVVSGQIWDLQLIPFPFPSPWCYRSSSCSSITFPSPAVSSIESHSLSVVEISPANNLHSPGLVLHFLQSTPIRQVMENFPKRFLLDKISITSC